MTNPLHDAAMAAKRFHDAALAYLDRPGPEAEAALDRHYMEFLTAQKKYRMLRANPNAKGFLSITGYNPQTGYRTRV